ncbi:MMPL family transporter [Streptomyces sp. JJ66]|uniref:MMPL family transporter n=1 Tax=Streptomyces sp. JJ66 TaxID=2803843 RepID=UPI001C58F0EA|nr:MMPL family transporter [Streptomyces sp. JJ66]MBW1601539.1 MMPL family transporter [Streptomyces sp. JJ66]
MVPPSAQRPAARSPRGAGRRPSRGVLYRTGAWCARHCVTVLAVWLAVAVGVQVLDRAFGGDYSDDFTLPSTQSYAGFQVLQEHEPSAGGYSAQIVLHDDEPLPDTGGPVGTAVTRLEKLPHVLGARNPLTAGQDTAVGPLSPDGKTAYITMRFDVQPSTLGSSYLDGVDSAVQPMRAAGVQVEYGGPLGDLARPQADDRRSEAIGFGAALIVLLLGFGSLLAALMPLVAALIAVACGLGLLGLLAAASTFATVSPTLATMIGLGVGIDYALFLITRHRQLLMDGRGPAVAAGLAAGNSGRAVVVSGCTVIIALSGLWVSGVSFIGKLGLAAAVTVITAVLGALTLVPALLGLAGRSVDRFHVRRPVAEAEAAGGGAGADVSGGAWQRYAQTMERRPWWFLGSGAVVLAVLAIPLFSIQLGHIDDGADPTSFTDRRAFDLMSSAFGPGSNGPLTVVIDQTDVPSADRASLGSDVQDALADVPDAALITPPQPSGDGDVLIATAYSDAAPQDERTTDLANRLVDEVLPQAVSGTGARTYVTGTTAAQVDFLETVSSRLPLIIAVVVCLAFLVILTVFRGVLVAVKAAVLNVLSIAAAYGVVVAVFQWGWGGQALGVGGTVPIESYVPMMMFAIVFGLSMDYEIFLLSRVREAWLRTGDAQASVAHALSITGRVITCAALIMTTVFAAFILTDTIVVKMLGLGLAVSVLIDATVVRLLLVPAALTLLGRAAWWAPRWLDRVLPHLDPEGAEDEPPAAPMAGRAAPGGPGAAGR